MGHSSFAEKRQPPKSCEENNLMNKRTLCRLISVLAALVMALSLLTGCGTKSTEQAQEQEDAQTIQVYLWTNALYETYAPYIQSQLPDVNIEFIVGNNDLDFYKFLQQNGGLPDIITCCRFSLHDAAPLKDSLMNLATTNEAGAVYNTYLNSFKNEDSSVNWLPVCADAHGFVVNRSLFEQYDIPLPTDYESFVAACQAFEKVGIRGFTADYTYDYTCMETLQGLSAAELITTEGRKWRTAYSDPANTARVGLDDTVWPGAFARLAQFIQDTHLTADDLALNYDDVTGMFRNGEVAMYFGTSAGVKMFQDEGIDTTFLPFFSQNGEKWLMTTPYFQVALNRDLEQDTARRNKAMKVLNVMLSEEAQNRIVAAGQDVLSYSQNVRLRLTEYLKDVRTVVEENHKLKEMNLTLPTPPAKGGLYTPVMEFGDHLLYCSGCGPQINGTSINGKLGKDLTVEQGQEAALRCMLNLLANLDAKLGDLNRIKRFVKVLAFVNSADDFTQQPQVVNGGSQLLLDLFGEERGLPARTAMGVNATPGDIAVEIELLAEYE